jgi:hypothetical protein
MTGTPLVKREEEAWKPLFVSVYVVNTQVAAELKGSCSFACEPKIQHRLAYGST